MIAWNDRAKSADIEGDIRSFFRRRTEASTFLRYFQPLIDVRKDMTAEIIYHPHSTPKIEAAIWSAVTDHERDWTEFERRYISINRGFRESLMEWCEYNFSDNCWTKSNLDFLRPYWSNYDA